MKKNKLHKQAFTLIEMLVSMTIFAMVMVSIMMIYASASDISAKYDINREARQNIKSLIEDISEEVRKNEIKGVANNYGDPYIEGEGTRLKLVKKRIIDEANNIEYKIKKFDYLGLEDNSLNCSDIKNICTIYKYKNGIEIGPLTNSKISFTNFKFTVTGTNLIAKVKINFIARAAIKNGLRPDLIKNSKIVFQTTISERLLKVK